MVSFRENLIYKTQKYKKMYNTSYRELAKKGIARNVLSILNAGSTRIKNLFKISKMLNVDIRNFLIFDNRTYVFKEEFNTFDEFYIYIRLLYKKIRNEKGLKAADIANRLDEINSSNSIYDFENGYRVASLEKIYKYLKAIGVTPDEFFLMNQEYEIVEAESTNEITIESFNNRVYELEKIKGRNIGSDIFINPNRFPTLHMFLKMCKSLRINPKDFFDFDKKDFNEDFKIKDISKLSNYIKNKLELCGFNVQKYIRMDSVFLFCSENGILLSEFLDFTRVGTNCVIELNN